MPNRAILTRGIAASMLLVLAGCDDFTRFRHEQYLCPMNPYGIGEIIINSSKKGDTAKMLTINGEKTLTIQDSSQKEINLVADDLFIHANRETGSLKLIRKNRFHTMQCEVSIFTM